MRALLLAALGLALGAGVPPAVAQLPNPQPGLPPPPSVPIRVPTTLTVPLTFTKLPTQIVPLHGRDPGASVQIAAAGGKEPLALAFNVDPAAYTSLFALEQPPPTKGPTSVVSPPGSGSTPSVDAPTIVRLLHFKGIVASQNLPSAPIHVFVRVTDGAGSVVEKTFDVRLTNSAAVPVIDSSAYAGNPGDHMPSTVSSAGAYNIFNIHHHGFLLSEPGSYFECTYPTGIKYKCHPWNDATGATNTTLLVPDLNLGASVSLRLVNDSGASSPVTLQLQNGSHSNTEGETVFPRGPVGTAFAQTDTTTPDAAAPYLDNTPTSCREFYLTWNDVSRTGTLTTAQVVPVPAGVTLKKKPKSGSVISSSNLPVWDWSVALATSVTFGVSYEYTFRVGACESDRVQ